MNSVRPRNNAAHKSYNQLKKPVLFKLEKKPIKIVPGWLPENLLLLPENQQSFNKRLMFFCAEINVMS